MTINRLNNFTSSFNANMRFEEVKSKIRNLEEKMKIPKTVQLKLTSFNESPSAGIISNTIKIPIWFLFKYEDIPLRFRITDLDDPRLNDKNYLNCLAEWMNERFREAGLSSVIRKTDYGSLQTVIKLMRDRNLYEKSKDFTLGHELSHLNHVQLGQWYLNHEKKSISTVGVIGGILLLFLAVSISPFVHLAVTLTAGGIAITISTLGILTHLKTMGSSRSVIEEEKIADMESAEVLQDATGGIYLFETYRHQNLAIRLSGLPQMLNIDKNGNNLRDKSHPPITERIAYLRAWQAQHV